MIKFVIPICLILSLNACHSNNEESSTEPEKHKQYKSKEERVKRLKELNKKY